MARYQLVKAAGGIPASWTTNQASETNKPYYWSIVTTDFSVAFRNNLCLAKASGWKGK